VFYAELPDAERRKHRVLAPYHSLHRSGIENGVFRRPQIGVLHFDRLRTPCEGHHLVPLAQGLDAPVHDPSRLGVR
jgi:hypothetical protein